MKITINKGEKKPKMTWYLFTWKFFLMKLVGLFSLPMTIWQYSKEIIAHRIVGKRSYFSKDGIAIVALPDQKHAGRFKFYAIVIEKGNKRAEFITVGYNNRKYSFKINRSRRSWICIIDGRAVEMEVSATPIFTYNLLPKLSERIEIKKDIIITLDD